MKPIRVFFAMLPALTMLSACGSDRPEWLGGEPKRPAADVVIGGKRRPILNPEPGMMKPPQPSSQEMMAPPPPPPMPAPAMKGGAPYPYPDEQEMPDASENSHLMPNENASRRNFVANPTYSKETEPTAPIPPAMAEPAVADQQETSWYARMRDRLSDEPASPEVEKIQKEPYPKLSDVPERPDTFAVMKTSQADKMEEMQSEHALAQEQREMLAAEPTQSDGEVLLGHAYDKKTGPAAPAATPKTATVVSTMKETPIAAPAPKTAEAKPAAGKKKQETVVKKTAKTETVAATPAPTAYDIQRQQEQALY